MDKVIDVEKENVFDYDGGEKMDGRLSDLIDMLKGAEGYLATVTVIRNGKLNHHLITSAFPELDILKSIGEVEKLAVARLKEL